MARLYEGELSSLEAESLSKPRILGHFAQLWHAQLWPRLCSLTMRGGECRRLDLT